MSLIVMLRPMLISAEKSVASRQRSSVRLPNTRSLAARASPVCEYVKIAVDTGASLSFEVTPAQEVPDELHDRLREAGLLERWERLSEAQRRMHAGSVFEARKPATRAARIERILASLQ